MKEAGAALVCVLGDPAYYGRFGFAPEAGVATHLIRLPEASGRVHGSHLA